MKKWIVLSVIVFAWISLDSMGYTQGCSQCKLVAEQASEADENSFGTNINSGILYLMAMPYLFFLFVFRKKIIRFFKSSTSPKKTTN